MPVIMPMIREKVLDDLSYVTVYRPIRELTNSIFIVLNIMF